MRPPNKVLNKIPPTKPSTVLFGLISENNGFFPKFEPARYAALSEIAEFKINIRNKI